MSCLCKYINNIYQEIRHRNCNNKDPRFVVNPTYGKVVNVYDGDTITLSFFLNGKGPFRHNIRLRRIDAPEIKTKDMNEKATALRSRDILRQLILNKVVCIKEHGLEKWGRLLCEVYIGDINISDYMLKNKLAVKYDGGTKTKFNKKNYK